MFSSAYNYRFHFNFPRIVEDSKGRYETENDSGRAVLHVREEFQEFQDAFSKDERSHALEEALDTIHAMETFLRLCYSEDEIVSMRDFIVSKNKRRNYYKDDVPDCYVPRSDAVKQKRISTPFDQEIVYCNGVIDGR